LIINLWKKHQGFKKGLFGLQKKNKKVVEQEIGKHAVDENLVEKKEVGM
jgi:hypothetical protein